MGRSTLAGPNWESVSKSVHKRSRSRSDSGLERSPSPRNLAAPPQPDSLSPDEHLQGLIHPPTEGTEDVRCMRYVDGPGLLEGGVGESWWPGFGIWERECL
jgi:hypothetical protein